MFVFISILLLRHKVKPGETLSSIAPIYSVNWRDICTLNKLPNCNDLKVGQILEIPDSETSTQYITYTVLQGDYLGKIANKYKLLLHY